MINNTFLSPIASQVPCYQPSIVAVGHNNVLPVSPFMPITQRSTPQDVSPLSHKQSPVSVQMYLQSGTPQKQNNPQAVAVPSFDDSPERSSAILMPRDVIVPINLSAPEGIEGHNPGTKNKDCASPKKRTEDPGPSNKNNTDQTKLASIVEESEHELTPPHLSALTDTSGTFTDSTFKQNLQSTKHGDGKRTYNCDGHSSSSCSSENAEETRVVTGCSSSSSSSEAEGDSGESSLSCESDNSEFDSECSDVSSECGENFIPGDDVFSRKKRECSK